MTLFDVILLPDLVILDVLAERLLLLQSNLNKNLPAAALSLFFPYTQVIVLLSKYLFKVNNKGTRTPYMDLFSDVFFGDFEHL